MVQIIFESYWEILLFAVGIILFGIYYIKYGESPSSKLEAVQRLTKDSLQEINAIVLTHKKDETNREVPKPDYIDKQLQGIAKGIGDLMSEFVQFKEDTTQRLVMLESDVKTLKGK